MTGMFFGSILSAFLADTVGRRALCIGTLSATSATTLCAALIPGFYSLVLPAEPLAAPRNHHCRSRQGLACTGYRNVTAGSDGGEKKGSVFLSHCCACKSTSCVCFVSRPPVDQRSGAKSRRRGLGFTVQMIARVFTGILFGFLIPANMALVIESAPPAYRGRHACMHAAARKRSTQGCSPRCDLCAA